MKTKTIRQSVAFPASPQMIYKMLMDSEKHSQFTGDTAKISRKIDGAFSTYGGYCYGTNLELVPDKKIVQSWRASDWPENHFSKVSIRLKKIKEGTRLNFRQMGVPGDQYLAIKDGWYEHYWNPMKEMLKNSDRVGLKEAEK